MAYIDFLDEQILDALQASGRLTMKALAEQVGLSSPAMIERVRRLEERGVIAGYRAVVAPAELGRPLTALVMAEVEHANAEAFLDRVRADPAIVECHRTTGAASYLVKAHVADAAALEQLVDDLSATGAHCSASLVLSSPVPWRGVTPPAGLGQQRPRTARRRRRSSGSDDGAEGVAASKRPGRPRGRRRSGES